VVASSTGCEHTQHLTELISRVLICISELLLTPLVGTLSLGILGLMAAV
jgi:hypothetical protein